MRPQAGDAAAFDALDQLSGEGFAISAPDLRRRPPMCWQRQHAPDPVAVIFKDRRSQAALVRSLLSAEAPNK